MSRVRLGPQLVPTAPTIERRYGLFRLPVVLESNDPVFVEAADLSLGRFPVPDDGPPLRLRLFAVDEPWRGGDNWRVSYQTDGRRYVLTTPDSVAVADIPAGEAVAFVGPHMRAEVAAVRRELVEGLSLAMATGGRGYSPIHAAGIARGSRGVALVGAAGAGKSTLTMAAARRGFAVFAEDAVYVRASEKAIEFWGMPWIQRLLPDALEMFPELTAIQPRLQPNGESKLEVDLDEWFPGAASPCANPAALVLLERRPGLTRLTPVGDDDEAQIELLWPWGDRWTPENQRAADHLERLPMYRLEMGGTPEQALDVLEPVFEELSAVGVTG